MDKRKKTQTNRNKKTEIVRGKNIEKKRNLDRQDTSTGNEIGNKMERVFCTDVGKKLEKKE